MAVKIPSSSREYVSVPIVATGTDATTLRTLPVRFAFVADGTVEPADAAYVTGSWWPTGSPPKARILVGPGGAVNPGEGTWYVWVWIQGAVEEPRRMVGKFVVT